MDREEILFQEMQIWHVCSTCAGKHPVVECLLGGSRPSERALNHGVFGGGLIGHPLYDQPA